MKKSLFLHKYALFPEHLPNVLWKQKSRMATAFFARETFVETQFLISFTELKDIMINIAK